MNSCCSRHASAIGGPLPGFSHLKELELNEITGCGRGWGLLQHMTALKSLRIIYSDELIELPECFWCLKSLQSLQVSDCSAIRVLPESLGELQSLQQLAIMQCKSLSGLPQSVVRLTSLRELRIIRCNVFQELPQRLGELRCLRQLEISGLWGQTRLPESMCGSPPLKNS